MSLLFEEIPLSPKLEVCGENEVDIRNQRPRLRRNRLILVERARGIFFRSTEIFIKSFKIIANAKLIKYIIIILFIKTYIRNKGLTYYSKQSQTTQTTY